MPRGTRFRTLIRETAGSFHRELLIALTPVPKPEKWVFVVGCYNSGTTLLAELMGRHSKISSLPTEGQFITDQLVQDYAVGLPRMWVNREDLFRMDEASEGPDVVRLKKEWGIRLDLKKPVLLEKSPPNGARTRWLQAHFENSHFIAIVRNGYAVAAGIRKKAEPHHIAGEHWPIEMAAHQWVRSNQVLLEDAPHLERLHWVHYEDLASNPQETLGGILAFLGLSFEAQMVSSEAITIHERTSTLKDFNASSIQLLSGDDIERINEVAEPMLRHHGYPILHAPDARKTEGGG